MSEIERIIVDPGQFLEFVANRSKEPVTVDDLVQAIKLANVGQKVGEQRKLPRLAAIDVFTDDILNTVQNSIFKVFVAVTGVASILDIVYKTGNTTSVLKALNGVALQPDVPKEFNFPVSRGDKINFRLETASTVEIIRVIEFRIGQ